MKRERPSDKLERIRLWNHAMGSYFKPWRRKFGAATLAVACVFTAGWMRSWFLYEAFEFSMFGTRYDISSAKGLFCFSLRDGLWWGGFDVYSLPLVDPKDGTDILEWQKGFLRCRENEGENVTFWQIPYLIIVTVLTLLSAWLLFSKPLQNLTARKPPAA